MYHGVFRTGKRVASLLEDNLVDLAQRRVVVEDVETAAEGCADEIVLAPLDGEVAEGNGWHAAFQFDPFAATVDGEENAELGGREEEILLDVVLDQPPHEVAVRDIADDRCPARTAIGALHQIGRKVAVLVVVETHIDGIGVKEIGLDVVDEGGAARRADRRPGSPSSLHRRRR